MVIAEIGLDDSYDKILKFAANAISARGSTSEEKQRYATYVVAATSVFVANRLDKALSVLRETTEASGRIQAEAAMRAAKVARRRQRPYYRCRFFECPNETTAWAEAFGTRRGF